MAVSATRIAVTTIIVAIDTGAVVARVGGTDASATGRHSIPEVVNHRGRLEFRVLNIILARLRVNRVVKECVENSERY